MKCGTHRLELGEGDRLYFVEKKGKQEVQLVEVLKQGFHYLRWKMFVYK